MELAGTWLVEAPELIEHLLTVTTNSSTGTLVCTPTSPVAMDDASLTAGEESTFSTSCVYTSLADGSTVTAKLTANYTTNGLTRDASGSPATITYTVQAD